MPYIANYSNKKKIYINFIVLNISTMIFYISLFFVSNILLENNINGLFMSLFFIICMIFFIFSLSICNICVSKTFHPINMIFNNLSLVNIFIKLICFICIVIFTRIINGININTIKLIIALALCVETILYLKKYNYINGIENTEIQSYIDKLVIISNDEYINYKAFIKLYYKLFIVFICVLPALKYIFINPIYIFVILTLYLIIMTIFFYKAYNLIFSKKQAIKRLIINICIGYIGIIIIVALFSRVIILDFYPVISNEELILLFVVFLIPYFYPVKRVYTLTKIYTLKNQMVGDTKDN